MEENKRPIYLIDHILNDICEFVYISRQNSDVIRIHSKKIDKLGDISLPLNIRNWLNIIDNNERFSTIFDYIAYKQSRSIVSEPNLEKSADNIKSESENWTISVDSVMILKDNIHFYFKRCKAFKETILTCFDMKQKYGALQDSRITSCHMYDEKHSCEATEMDLNSLRLIILKKVVQNLSNFNLKSSGSIELYFSNNKRHKDSDVMCGHVVEECGKKKSAEELFRKRSIDMRLMAEHKYGLRLQSSEKRNEYFRKLGEASVTIELLQNKPHKNIKISFDDLSSANKGASFIFYNCARLSALFKEFEKKVSEGIYPELIPIEDIDWTLLNQPEEWELLYVYIIQYPLLIRSCLRDVDKGIVNPHYLVSFLANMCGVFSAYYRRIRILVTPKPHLIATLNARIYLLKSLEQVLHNTFRLLHIEPIKQM